MSKSGAAITIRYGSRRLSLAIPEGVHVDTVGRQATENSNELSVLQRALAAPLAAPLLSDFLAGGKSVLVVVNDATRSTPNSRILPYLIPVLRDVPSWSVIIASGLHRGPTNDEKRSLFGGVLSEVEGRLLVHDGYDASQLETVGSGETHVQINRHLLAADRILLINSIEPHFFAGYTGGRKSILPGLAGHDTVERSHAGAVSERSTALRVEGNPVREFIHSRTQFIDPKRIWSIQVVLDREDRMAAVFAGHVDQTFAAGCEAARASYTVEIEQPYDLVLAVLHPPLDMSLYQAMKGWELPAPGVRDGGFLVFSAPCWEGVGAKFYSRLIDEYPDVKSWMALETKPYTLGLHKLVRTARARRRFRLLAVTGMPVEQVRRFGYEAYDSHEAALATALAQLGRPCRMLVVEDSALTTIVRKNKRVLAPNVGAEGVNV